MNIKKLTTVLFVIFSLSAILKAQTSQSVPEVILSGYSSKVFTSTPVIDKDIDLIVQCGMKAPSGMNQQPWKFTVVKSPELVNAIMQNVTPGNVFIVISGISSTSGTIDQNVLMNQFSLGMATENMYIAGQGLGYGTHIYMGPVANINTNMKDKLGIPANYNAVALLRIGGIEKSADAASGASTRKPMEEVVIMK